MVGWDAQRTGQSLTARSVGQDELLAALGRDAGVPIIAVVDACFSGRDTTGGELLPGVQPVREVVPDRIVSAKTALLVAARSDQYAGSFPGLGRPAFSWLALGALRGWADGNRDGNRDGKRDGTVTAGEVTSWAAARLVESVNDRVQTPEVFGAADLVLSRGTEPGPDLSLTSSAYGVPKSAVVAPAATVVAAGPTPVAKAASVPTPGKEWVSPTLGVMKWIPPGTFTMGSPEGVGDRNEHPAHRVTLTKGFWLMEHEVTQGQWEAVMGSNPAERGTDFYQGPAGLNCFASGVGSDLPVVCVGWDEILWFVRRVSSSERGSFRLPSAAEWEYAALGGNAWSAPSDHQGHASPACQNPRNGNDLCDMVGNVWEVLGEEFDMYAVGSATDPFGQSPRPRGWEIRGGGWCNPEDRYRPQTRWNSELPSFDVGFRLAMSPP